jgi:hypothetical protein
MRLKRERTAGTDDQPSDKSFNDRTPLGHIWTRLHAGFTKKKT